MPALPQSRPVCQPFETSAAAPPSTGHDDQTTEAVLVAVERDRRRVGRPRERPLPGTPRRLGVFVLLRRARTSACHRPRGDAIHTFIQPSSSATNASASPDRREAWLTDRDVVTPGDHRRHGVGSSRASRDDARAVPGHVREVPLVPGERATVGGPRRIPRVVGVRHPPRPLRRRRASTTAMSHAVVALHARTRPGCRRGRRPGRRRGRRATSTRTGPPVAAIDEEPAVGRGVDEGVVVDPGVAAAAVGTERGHGHLGGDGEVGARTVGGGHHEIDPAAEGVEPGQAGRRRATSAPRPGCATPRRTAAAEMPVSGPRRDARALNRDCKGSDLHVRSDRAAVCETAPLMPSPPRVSASPGWSTGATRTAAARGSTPAISPGS